MPREPLENWMWDKIEDDDEWLDDVEGDADDDQPLLDDPDGDIEWDEDDDDEEC